MDQDAMYLRLLSVFHYVVGGITAVFTCFPLFQAFFGILALRDMANMMDFVKGPPPPSFLGWIYVVVGAMAITLGWGLAIVIFLAGKFLSQHTHYLYCLVVAAVECIFMPFGTVLGVFTIIVLTRPSVKLLFPETGGNG
jgi:hypothetical protein